MAVSNFSFTKNWNSKNDFPTIETNEAKVRSDIQLLHDEVKNFINGEIIPVLNAVPIENLPATNEVTEDDSKLPTSEAVRQAILQAITGSGNVPSGGNEMDILVKFSNEDGDFGWYSLSELFYGLFIDSAETYIPVGTIVSLPFPFSNQQYGEWFLCNGETIEDPGSYYTLWDNMEYDYTNPYMEDVTGEETYLGTYNGIYSSDKQNISIYGKSSNGYNYAFSKVYGQIGSFVRKTVGDASDEIHSVRRHNITESTYENWFISSNGTSVYIGKIHQDISHETKISLFTMPSNHKIDSCDSLYYGGKHWFLINYGYSYDSKHHYKLFSYDGSTVHEEKSGTNGYEFYASDLSLSVGGDYIGFALRAYGSLSDTCTLSLLTYKTNESWEEHTMISTTGIYIYNSVHLILTGGNKASPDGIIAYEYRYEDSSDDYIRFDSFSDYAVINSKSEKSVTVIDKYINNISNTVYFYCIEDTRPKIIKFNFNGNQISGYEKKEYQNKFNFFHFGELPVGIMNSSGIASIYTAKKTLPMLSGKGLYYYIKAK